MECLCFRALKKVEVEETPVEEKGPILDLIAFLSVVKMEDETAEKVLQVSARLTTDTSHMKRSYRILSSLIKNEFVSEEIQGKIANVLRENKGKTKSNAEPLRLECIIWLVLQVGSYGNITD